MASQKDRVLSMLKAAGKFGVRSDTYIAEFMPRAAARIKELRDEGYEISSEREGKFVRWTLVGSGGEVATVAAARDVKAPGLSCDSSASSERPSDVSQLRPGASGEPGTSRSVPSLFDADDCVDWGEAA